MADAESFGKRVARLRRLRGLSQPQLAAVIKRSPAWVSQVERGQRHIDRMSVLETLARALNVPLSELAGDEPVVAAQHEVNDDVERLRIVLLTTVPLPVAAVDVDLSKLGQDLERAWGYVHGGDFAALPNVLGPLVSGLDSACSSLPPDRRPWEQLASAYHAMAAAFAKLGEPGDAWIASDRAVQAARSSGDPVLAAASAFRLAIAFLGARRYEYAELTAAAAADSLSGRLDELGVAAWSVWGALTLQRAVAAARINNAEHAYTLLEDARAAAAKVGDGRNDHHTEFGPLNVLLHDVSVSVDLGDAGRALRVAEGIDARALSAERRTRFSIDLARAHMQRRDAEKALSALLAAEELSPQIVYEHHLARQILGDLLAVADDPSPELQELGRRSGVLRP
jgi:transcriptional regulator with XRE-family HTH domain